MIFSDESVVSENTAGLSGLFPFFVSDLGLSVVDTCTDSISGPLLCGITFCLEVNLATVSANTFQIIRN